MRFFTSFIELVEGILAFVCFGSCWKWILLPKRLFLCCICIVFNLDFFQPAKMRKGIKAHQGIIEAYMQGLDLQEMDRFIIVDLLPNRLDGYQNASKGRCSFRRKLVAQPVCPTRFNAFVDLMFVIH